MIDTSACAANPQVPNPNAMDTTTGNTVSQSLSPGMAFGTGFSDGGPGRLARTHPLLFGGAGATPKRRGYAARRQPAVGVHPRHVPGGHQRAHLVCQVRLHVRLRRQRSPACPSSLQNFLAPKSRPERMLTLLQRCFTHYNGLAWDANGAIVGSEASSCPAAGCVDPVFSRNSSTSDQPDLYDIQYTPRFGYVPQLTTGFPNGNSTVDIQSFRAIFFQRLLGSCSANSCGVDFQPGLGINQANSATDAEAITAFVFPLKMLPNRLAESDSAFQVGRNRFVRLVR